MAESVVIDCITAVAVLVAAVTVTYNVVGICDLPEDERRVEAGPNNW